MKKAFIIFGLLGLVVAGGLYFKRKLNDKPHLLETAKSEVANLSVGHEIRNGDLIFQTSRSGQSQAIQLATGSKYSHCGIIYQNGDKYFVFEAVQPVKLTPLADWIARGQDGKYVIKRLKEADKILDSATLERMKLEGAKLEGKSYDLTFEWSDEKIYCSELIWKIYKRGAGIEIGELQQLRDFDLSNDAVKRKMKERYGDKVPLNENVISPVSIFDSNLLVTVKSN